MKRMDIFCASQAATAICLSMEQPSSSSPSSNLLLGSSSPAIDRYNPIITDSRRSAIPIPIPLPPPTPKPHKKKKNPKPKLPPKQNKEIINKNENASTASSSVSRKSWSCTKPGEFISPPGSTRYLLSEKVLLNALSDFKDEPCDAKPPSSSAAPDQVVVLRVSLHCRGCERKMRKHISRMEGVRSFNIDFAAKKVTVTGNVTAVEVLSSISKVMKNAQLWGPGPSPSPTISEFKGAAAAWATPTPTDIVGVAS